MSNPLDKTRTMQRLMRSISVSIDTKCWNWQKCQDGYGYGVVRVNTIGYRVHRLVFALCVGEIPEGLVLDHLCRNRLCCNPRHLEPVTIGENVKRGFATVTHCNQGHEYTPQNTLRHHKRRRCRECHNAQERERHARRKSCEN